MYYSHCPVRLRQSKSSPKMINDKNNLSKSLKRIKKIQILFPHKSFLEVILGLIKNCQLEYFSVFSNENNINANMRNSAKKKKKVIYIKSLVKMLTTLKNTMNLIQKEKQSELIFIKNENKTKKNILEQKSKKITKLKEGINRYKTMNFQIENEIQKISNIIKSKNDYIYLIKSYTCFLEIFSEFIKSNDNEEIDDIYKSNILNEKSKLVKLLKETSQKEKEIQSLKKEIIEYKDLKEKRENETEYIYSDVISEDPKEYIDTITKEKNINNSFESEKSIENNKINIIENNNINIIINSNNNNKNKLIKKENRNSLTNIKSNKTIIIKRKKNNSLKNNKSQRLSCPSSKFLLNNKANKSSSHKNESCKCVCIKIFKYSF